MVSMTVVMRVPPEKRNEILDTMGSLQKDRLKEQGIIRSKIYENHLEPNRFFLVDEWETDESLLRYLGKEGFRILLGALRTLCTEAQITYDPLHREDNGSILQTMISDGTGRRQKTTKTIKSKEDVKCVKK